MTRILNQQNEIQEQLQNLASSQVFLQGLLHQVLAHQERIFGKITLMSTPQMVFASPPKHFASPSGKTPHFRREKLSFRGSPKTERIPVLTTSSAATSGTTPILDISGESALAEPHFNLERSSNESRSDLSFAELQKISYQSSSIPNMAKRLVERLFTPDERNNCNCSGAKGKGKLDPLKLAKVKQSIFEMHTMSAVEEEITWRKCKEAINEAGRRKKP